MKPNLIIPTLVCILISTTIFAQSKKKTSGTNNSYLGTWKLVSDKVTYPNGQVFVGDSSTIIQRKIITPTSFVIIIEKKIPDYNNNKLATSVAGGRFVIDKGNYREFTQYASWKGFEVLKINGKLSVENGKLHLVANGNNYVGFAETTIFDEWYIREE
ncbi:MAG: hypothetical protein JWR50_2428 [Mucilaginibacter sp.]|nr:hypothetical protein [Mucilaginibacter sp.]